MDNFDSGFEHGDRGSAPSDRSARRAAPEIFGEGSASSAYLRAGSVQRPGVRSERVIGDIVAAIDFVLIAGAAAVAKWAYIGMYLGSRQHVEAYFGLGLIAGFIAVAAFRSQALYSIELLRRFSGTARRVLFGVGIATVAILSVGYLLKVLEELSRGWTVTWLAGAALLVVANHYLVSQLIQSRMASGWFRRNVAIYGSGEVAGKMIEHLNRTSRNYRILGVFDDLPDGVTPHVALSGGLSHLIQMGQTAHIDEVLIAPPFSGEQNISEIVAQLSVLPVDIRLCPDKAAFHIRPLGLVNYDGVSVLELVRRPLDDWGPIIKTVEDRVLGIIALAAASPLMLLVGLAIKLDSDGPVFFRQRRHGFNHQIITVLKFRTMHVAEDGPVVPQAQRDDPRVTRLGKWLRRTSIDELPQLINVIRGQMSLVGPRPHALAHNEQYSALLVTYANRHRMRPGITGWAQINGHRGETDTPEKMHKRVECDLYYIENWSFWLDLRILLLTPIYVFFSRNAY